MANRFRRHQRKIIGTALIAVATSLFSFGWQFYSERYSNQTDNAYIRGDVTSYAPKVGGYVVSVEVRDNQFVRTGQILYRIDDKDYRARLAQADANLAAASARFRNTTEDIALQQTLVLQARAQRQSATADLALARKMHARRSTLRSQGFATSASVDESAANLERAQAAASSSGVAIEAQQQRVEVLRSQLANIRAAVDQAKAQRELTLIDLHNTVVRAPISGVIGNRQVRVGRLVAQGTPLLDIVPVQSLYVVANFKETQLRNIRIGQRVRVEVDGFPGIELRGKVNSFAPGSGAAFSLIPPDSSTGNFVRIVQRVPVKIELTDNPLIGRLVPGLSAKVQLVGRP